MISWGAVHAHSRDGPIPAHAGKPVGHFLNLLSRNRESDWLLSTGEISAGNEGAEGRGQLEGVSSQKAKVQTQSRAALPPHLQRVHEAAKRDRQLRFTALLHHVNVASLERAFRRLRRNASAGVDGETVDRYEQDLSANL